MKGTLTFISALLAGVLIFPATTIALHENGLKQRWTRQIPSLNLRCDDVINGCWIYFNCITNIILDLCSVICHLDGRQYYGCVKEINPLYDLSVRIEANLASVNDRQHHNMILSVRGQYGDNNLTIPWPFSFRVLDCPISSGVITTQPPAPPPTTELPTQKTTEPLTDLTMATTVTTVVTFEEPEMTAQTTTTTTTQSTLLPPTQPTTQSTSRPTTQPTTATSTQPTNQPTPQLTTHPTTQPTTQSTTTTQPTQPSVLPSCRIVRNSADSLIINCSSNANNIRSISSTVNAIQVGMTSGSIVNISQSDLREGNNIIRLVITYNDGSRYTYSMTYEFNRQVIRPNIVSCQVRCNGTFSVGTGLSVTCTVTPLGQGIHRIMYNINNQGERKANGTPTFFIEEDQFATGPNHVVITVDHSTCGQANVTLNFTIPEPTPVCLVHCIYRDYDHYRHFNCSIGNAGSFSSVNYSINGGANRTLATVISGAVRIIFKILFNELTPIIQNSVQVVFHIICGSQCQQLQNIFYITYTPPSFQITQRGCNLPTVTSNPSFSLSLNISAHTNSAVDLVVIQPYNTSQRVWLFLWSVNEPSRRHSRIGSVLNIPKAYFRSGRNNLYLRIFGVLGGEIYTNCILDIQM